MLISSLKNINLNRNIHKVNKSEPNFCSINFNDDNDIFQLSIPAKEIIMAQNIINSVSKFGIKDYKSLSVKERNALRNSSNEIVKEEAEITVSAGLHLKSYLDKKYGKDGYAYVAIGTSPSGIGRVMEFSGVETKYLPISNISDENYLFWIEKNESILDNYKKFLEEQGIESKKISDSKKKYLFFDYTCTGNSLKNFGDILKNYCGINTENIEYLSLNNEFMKSIKDCEEKEDLVLEYIEDYIRTSRIAKDAGIMHLPIYKLNEIENYRSFHPDGAKRFNFLVIDILNKKKLLKENPSNKNSI